MTPKDFASLLRVPTLPAAAHLAVLSGDFTRRVPFHEEQEEITLRVLAQLDAGFKNVSADTGLEAAPTFAASIRDERRELWDRCYGDMDKNQGLDLLPPFLVKSRGTPVRFAGRFEIPASTLFEANFLNVVRAYLCDRAFANTNLRHIFEFGCGSGHNLLALARQLPGMGLTGLDWSQAAVQMVAERLSPIGITARLFDFFDPDMDVELGPAVGVLTIGAMEQVGLQWQKFFSFLLAKKPAIVVQLEPIVELYNHTVFDYLAARYHRQRGYLETYLPALYAFEKRGSLEILEVNRLPFGSQFHDAYTILIWRPK